uniref:Uncharacterized protein n=1 Tax=Arundo donax TaxID=35708 RepID=A0A0A8YYH4_ARUDO
MDFPALPSPFPAGSPRRSPPTPSLLRCCPAAVGIGLAWRCSNSAAVLHGRSNMAWPHRRALSPPWSSHPLRGLRLFWSSRTSSGAKLGFVVCSLSSPHRAVHPRTYDMMIGSTLTIPSERVR